MINAPKRFFILTLLNLKLTHKTNMLNSVALSVFLCSHDFTISCTATFLLYCMIILILCHILNFVLANILNFVPIVCTYSFEMTGTITITSVLS